MITIHKYPLKITDNQTLYLPRDAQILSVQMQGDQLCLWALIDTDAPLYASDFGIYGTGNYVPTLPSPRRHLATVQDHRGLVWHIFLE